MARISGLWYIVIFCFFVLSCQHAEQEINAGFELKSAWEFRIAGGKQWLPASVPGDVASDLYRNHKIVIPSINHINQIRWIDTACWEYRTVFDIPKEIVNHNFVNFNFDRLNSRADIYLNDSLILKTNNMFRSWNVECKRFLKPSKNCLRVFFHPVKNEKDSFIRRTVYQENLPGTLRLQNAGIGCPVRIQAWSTAKIEEVNLRQVSLTHQNALYIAEISVLSDKAGSVSAEILLNNKVVGQISKWDLQKGHNSHSVNFNIKKPKLWFPNGLGKPYLYDLAIRLKKGYSVLQETHQNLGVRTVGIIHPQNKLNSFYFKINGTPLFIKGAEYIAGNSCNLFMDTVSRQHFIESARDAHLNLLRITNEGIYEDDDFFNFCDKNGILVWQDFMVADAKPTSDTAWWNNINRETTDIIRKYRNHPSLVLWSGSNQNLHPSARPNDLNFLFQSTFPLLVKRNGGQTDYLATRGKTDNPLVSPLLEDNRFASFPSLQTMNRFENPANMGSKQDEIKAIYNYIRQNYRTPANTEKLIYLSQLAQAEVMKNTIEKHRREMPVCMGSIFSRLNDYSPSVSYSVMDSKHWKPTMFAIKNAYSHILVMPVREKKQVNIYAASDALKDQDAILLARLIDFNGKDLFVKQIPITLKANSCKLLLSLKESELLKNINKSQCCFVVQLNQPNITLSKNILYFTEPKNLALTKPQISVNINQSIKGYNLILRTDRLAKNVWLETNSGLALFSANNIDLLPGKRTKIPIRYSGSKESLYKDLKIKTLADIK